MMVNPNHPRRIVVIDDDTEISQSLHLVLTATGYEVVVARDGVAGLLECERLRPDLVILDMMMPKQSGFLVLETLRQHQTFPSRVIMITANDGDRHREYAKQLGVDAYIQKPFSMESFLTEVDRVLKKDES